MSAILRWGRGILNSLRNLGGWGGGGNSQVYIWGHTMCASDIWCPSKRDSSQLRGCLTHSSPSVPLSIRICPHPDTHYRCVRVCTYKMDSKCLDEGGEERLMILFIIFRQARWPRLSLRDACIQVHFFYWPPIRNIHREFMSYLHLVHRHISDNNKNSTPSFKIRQIRTANKI